MLRMLPNFLALSEFWGFRDTCGPDALLMGMHALSGTSLNGPTLDALRADMLAHGLFAPGGCTIADLRQEALNKGYSIVGYDAWGTAVATLHQHLIDQSGAHAVVLQISAAHNLPGNEPNVNSHFVGVGGIDSIQGYYIGNGDDVNALNAANGHGKIIPARWMSFSQIANAQPVALLVFDKTGGGTVGGTTVAGVPSGWSDDGTTLKAPNGMPLIHGIRDYVLAHNWNADDWPLEAERGVPVLERHIPGSPSGVIQTFRLSRLIWDSAHGTRISWIGAELLNDEVILNAAGK